MPSNRNNNSDTFTNPKTLKLGPTWFIQPRKLGETPRSFTNTFQIFCTNLFYLQSDFYTASCFCFNSLTSDFLPLIYGTAQILGLRIIYLNYLYLLLLFQYIQLFDVLLNVQ